MEEKSFISYFCCCSAKHLSVPWLEIKENQETKLFPETAELSLLKQQK